jgi:proteasome lid subunit RPN8/RPN11
MVRISPTLLAATWQHLRNCAPAEGVGLWLGRGGRVLYQQPLANRHPQPRLAYLADPQELAHHLLTARSEQLELLAIYHSHPVGSAQPSPTDRAQAFWPVPQVIFALQENRYRAWLLPEGRSAMVIEESDTDVDLEPR